MLTEFEIFQAVRDAYLSRFKASDTIDIFAWAKARVKAEDLGLTPDQAHELCRQIRLNYGPKKA